MFLVCEITQMITAYLHHCQAAVFLLLHQWYLRQLRALCSCDGQYPNPMQVLKLGSKKESHHSNFVCLLQELGFPCSGYKDLSKDRGFFAQAVQLHREISKFILPGQTQEQREGKKSHLQPSVLGEQPRESPAESSSLTPNLCRFVWRGDGL